MPIRLDLSERRGVVAARAEALAKLLRSREATGTEIKSALASVADGVDDVMSNWNKEDVLR